MEQHRLNRLWIGGSPGAGKTTVARTLARRHGLRWYNADARTWDHRDRALRDGDTDALRFEELDPVSRWRAPIPQLLRMSLHQRRGPMVAADVAALPGALTIAEGTPVTPKVTGDDPAVWLLIPPRTQRDRLAGRGLGPGQTALYLALGEVIAHESAGARVLHVDELSIDATVAAVAELFAEPIAAGPTAHTADERRQLLCYANRALVDQVRGYFARPWARGDASAITRVFMCECGAPGCAADVELPIGAYTPPVLADGHTPPF